MLLLQHNGESIWASNFEIFCFEELLSRQIFQYLAIFQYSA